MDKEIKIIPPEGYEIDKENSTFEYIKFKPIEKKWRGNTRNRFTGYFINNWCEIIKVLCFNVYNNYNVFATEKQAKSALAMARISQIMANDKRFGGVVTDEEWNNMCINKYTIERNCEHIFKSVTTFVYNFLAFHTLEQRNLFLEENEDLVKDYLMIN